jgi:hypothetical protein
MRAGLILTGSMPWFQVAKSTVPVYCSNRATAMIYSSFGVGFLTSVGALFYINEKLRDRQFLCDKKFDEEEVRNYKYRMVGSPHLHNV